MHARLSGRCPSCPAGCDCADYALAGMFPIGEGLAQWMRRELAERKRCTIGACVSVMAELPPQLRDALAAGRLFGVKLRTCPTLDPRTVRLHFLDKDEYDGT